VNEEEKLLKAGKLTLLFSFNLIFGFLTTTSSIQNGKANAVLRELYRSVVTKRELSRTSKMSGFKSVFVSILTCGHEFWVMTEKKLSQAQAAEMGFF